LGIKIQLLFCCYPRIISPLTLQIPDQLKVQVWRPVPVFWIWAYPTKRLPCPNNLSHFQTLQIFPSEVAIEGIEMLTLHLVLQNNCRPIVAKPFIILEAVNLPIKRCKNRTACRCPNVNPKMDVAKVFLGSGKDLAAAVDVPLL
jgi:hypothetical protein